jgi:hypothetical protein
MSDTSLTRRRLLQTAGALPLALGGLAHADEAPVGAVYELKTGRVRFLA